MSKKLLIETRMNSLSLCESKSKTPHPGCLGTMEGPCADFKKATRNNNLYGRKLWENVFKDPIVKESLEDRILIGELDHPGDRLETKAVNAAIVMTDYGFDEEKGLVNGTFDILDTPNGRILKSLLDYGCKIGVSSRGEGDVTTDEEGVDVVDEDSYNFIAFDAVVLPAVKDAKPTLRESLDREKSETLRESLTKEVNSATTISELNLIKKVVEATDLPDSDSLLESVNNKSQELTEGTTGSSSNLLEDLEKANGQINSLEREVASLREELTTRKSQIARMLRSRQKLVKESKSIRRELESANSERSCAVMESSSTSRRVESLVSQVSSSKRIIESLRNKVKSLRKENFDLTSKVESLESSLVEAQKDSRAKATQLESASRKIKDLDKSSKTRIDESVQKVSKVQKSVSRLKENLSESQKAHQSFVSSYVEGQCKVRGVSSEAVIRCLKEGMSKSDIDELIESFVQKDDRYRSLTFANDRLLSSLGRGSVSFSGKAPAESEESAQTSDFMREVNKFYVH